MKALSLWQPWASAIPFGWKRIETRHWSTAYRGPLAIHAAKRWTADEREEWEIACQTYGMPPGQPPLGAVIAVTLLVDVRRTETLLAEGVSPEEQEWGNFGPGRFGWMLADIVALPRPIPFKGAQGLFEVPDDLFATSHRSPPPPPRQGSLL